METATAPRLDIRTGSATPPSQNTQTSTMVLLDVISSIINATLTALPSPRLQNPALTILESASDSAWHLFALSTTLFLLSYTLLNLATRPRRTPAGCRKLPSAPLSSLSDQYSRQYSSGVAAGSTTRAGEPAWRIKGLFVYPIKSCQGVEVAEIEVRESGCQFDRDFVFAQLVGAEDEETTGRQGGKWHFVTLRTVPRLAHVGVEVWEPDEAAQGYAPEALYVQSRGCMVISFPRVARFGGGVQGLRSLFNHAVAVLSQRSFNPQVRVSFTVPYSPTPSQIESLGLSTDEVKLWGDWPIGIDMANAIPKGTLHDLQQFLDIKNPFTLFRKDPRVPREVHRNADDIESLGYQANTAFADSFPINLLNLASVHDVASRLPAGFGSLSARRFRCNLLMTGPPPFAEESWKSIYLPSTPSPLVFHLTNRATRCALPNVDPDQTNPRLRNTVAYGKEGYNEPFNTLRKYRAVDEGAPGKACLGMMVVPDGTTVGRRVRVGMEVVVGSEGMHVLRT